MEYANKLVSFNPHTKSSALDTAVRFVLQIHQNLYLFRLYVLFYLFSLNKLGVLFCFCELFGVAVLIQFRNFCYEFCYNQI